MRAPSLLPGWSRGHVVTHLARNADGLCRLLHGAETDQPKYMYASRERDVDAALALVTDDIVFEATSPAPDGQRVQGRNAVREAWTEVMRTPGMSFTEEESFVSGDRAVVRWQYAWAARSSRTSKADRRGDRARAPSTPPGSSGGRAARAPRQAHQRTDMPTELWAPK